MKKIYILLCVAAILFIFTGVQKSQAEMKIKPTRTYIKKPDLVAVITFVDVKTYKNSAGIQCYEFRPIFTITNKGQSTARNFEYSMEYTYKSNTWMVGTPGRHFERLAAGKTITIDNPIDARRWCVNETNWRPAFRIKVDTKNAVAESDEKNNVAEKTFLSIPRTKTLQRR
jgi:hypothetical protein